MTAACDALATWICALALHRVQQDTLPLCGLNARLGASSPAILSQIIISDPSTGQKVATLDGHESYVKGLAWDPVRARFLAVLTRPSRKYQDGRSPLLLPPVPSQRCDVHSGPCEA